MLFVGAANLLPGSAHAEAAHSDSPAVEVGINQVSPQIPDFNDTKKQITFAGKIRNTGTSTLRGVHLEVWRSLVTSRASMGSANGAGYPVQTKAVTFTELAAGAPQSWKLAPTETELFGYRTPQPGVYAIDIDAFDDDGVFLGGQRTYMVWKPTAMSGAKPARIALMWPVVGQPGLTGQKKPDYSAAPILSDQSVVQQFAPGSRLTRILTEGAGLPLVNWLVDPDLLNTANTLSGGYFYSDPNANNSGGSSPGTGSSGGNGTSSKLTGAPGTDPKNWYGLATTTLAGPHGNNCWNLLYGDPDLNTLSRSDPGKSVLKAVAKVKLPISPCRVNGQTGQTIAWPSDGQADSTTLAGIADAGSKLVTLVGSNQVSGWPSAHAALPGSPDTVVYDNYLSGSSIFADPAKTAPPTLNTSGVLEGQMWLAQTALADRDNSGRVLVVTPPRDFDPPQELLQAISSMNPGTVPAADQWFGLDDLGKVLNTPATPEHASALSPVTTANLSTDIVASASDSQQLYDALHDIMPSDQHDPAVSLRPTATWWRNHSGDAAYSQTVYSTAVADHALVSIGGQAPPLTMSGKSGTVPVTIRNQTNTAITVYVRAHTSHTVQLKVNEDQGPHSVERGQSATIRIPVKGEGNGVQVDLYATLYTCPDMTQNCTYYPSSLIKPINEDGGHTKVTVKVSRIGIIALGLIIGSGILLVLLIGLRVYRAKRTHHAPAQDTMAS